MALSCRLGFVLAASLALTACERPSRPDHAPRTEAQAPVSEAPAVAPPPATTPLGDGAPGQAKYSRAYQACMASGDAAKGVTSAMAECVVNELEVEDGKLNAAYQRVIAGLDEQAQTSLRQAQRAWIADRDRRCRAQAAGGTIDRINIPACVLDVTIARTRELEAMAPAG